MSGYSGSAHDIVLDSSGNIYTVGIFAGTVDFDPGVGTFNLSSVGDNDIFISKLDSSGNFVWAKRIGGTRFDFGRSIALDSNDNVYTTGSFQLIVDFDPSAEGTYNLTSEGNNSSIFVSKLDNNGNFIWAKSMGVGGAGAGSEIAITSNGDVYTIGSFYDPFGDADFDPGVNTYNLTNAGWYDVFVSKLDSNGNFLWAKSMGGATNDYGGSIAVDLSSNIYTTGNFGDTADFDPSTDAYNLTSGGEQDIFVSKLDDNGNFLWAKNMGGTDYDQGNSITIDSIGNIYTIGDFDGTADFDPGTGTYNLTSAGGYYDIFISKLNNSGDFLWAKGIGGAREDAGSGIAVDLNSNIYITGFFGDTVDFDPGTGIYNLTSGGLENIFISKLELKNDVDNTPPSVLSITRIDPNLTSASSVNFTVTFSEDINGMDMTGPQFDDFILTTGPDISDASVTGVSGVSGSGSIYTVTVNTGSGNGTLNLNLIDIDTILDEAGNKLGGTGADNGNYTADEAYTIDKTAPTVVSSMLVNPDPTNLVNVSFAVTFSEAVTGVDTEDFSLTTTGITGAAITSVSGSGTTRTVTVNTGIGSGALRLNVEDNDTILDEAGNKLGGTGTGNGNYTDGQTYTIIDNAAPTVASSVRINPNPTNLANVGFTVTFSETVTGVDAADFNLTSTSITGAKITAVSGSGATRTVTVSTGSGNGTLRLNVVDNDTILDAAGNKLGGTGTGNGNYTAGQTYTITDKTAPKVISSVRVNPNHTNLARVKFTVKFSEAVTGVDAADFNLTLTGIKGAKVIAVSGSGTTRTVTVSTGTGKGTLRLNLKDNDTILDAARNKLGGTGAGNGNYTAGQPYTIDKVAPKVISSMRVNPSTTNLASVKFTVAFSEAVTGVDAADFNLTVTGIKGAKVIAVSGSGATYTVTVRTGTGNGTLGLNVVDNDTILDKARNKLGGAGKGNGKFTAGQTYTIRKP